jgi:hypothetical protein
VRKVIRDVLGLTVHYLLLAHIYPPAEVWEVLMREAVNEVLHEYHDQLTNFVYETLNGHMTVIDFRRSHKALIRMMAMDAFSEGMREGGIADPQSWMDDYERESVKAWIADQVGYVDNFADAVAAAKSADERKAIIARVDLWVDALRSLGTQGEMSAKGNLPGTWEYDPNKEHCQAHDGRVSCAWLNGQRHRLKWFLSKGYIPQQKGSLTLGCGGWQCGCKIAGDDGRVLAP